MAGAGRRRDELAEVLGRLGRATTSTARARKPSARVKVEECPHGPGTGLCRLCGWSGKSIPRAWAELPPGSAYEGKSKLLGARVKLRGDEVESVVVALATPVGPSLLQTGRLSKRASCEGAVIVRTPLGAGAIETAVRKSVVRERRRLDERGRCPDAPSYSAASLAAAVAELERDARRLKKAPFELAGFELPYPHRKGSSPCCAYSVRSVEKLRGLVERYQEEGEESDFERAAVELRRALPRGMRETARLDNTRDLTNAVADVEAYCWAQWQQGAARAKETRKVFERRAKDLAKERKRLELPRGTVNSRRRQVEAGEGFGVALAELAGDSFDVDALELQVF